MPPLTPEQIEAIQRTREEAQANTKRLGQAAFTAIAEQGELIHTLGRSLLDAVGTLAREVYALKQTLLVRGVVSEADTATTGAALRAANGEYRELTDALRRIDERIEAELGSFSGDDDPDDDDDR